jgi:hypothetical protein
LDDLQLESFDLIGERVQVAAGLIDLTLCELAIICLPNV